MARDHEAHISRDKDGRAWHIGDDAEVAWIKNHTEGGVAITSATPPVFDAHATVVLPCGDQEQAPDEDRHEEAVLTVLTANRAPGHLSRQGSPALRWALYEAAQRARFPRSPDREYYLQAAERIGGNRACLALARKLRKRSYHILKGLGDQALQPAGS
jgi:hypothetical protein